jgi:hypothetical protein
MEEGKRKEEKTFYHKPTRRLHLLQGGDELWYNILDANAS